MSRFLLRFARDFAKRIQQYQQSRMYGRGAMQKGHWGDPNMLTCKELKDWALVFFTFELKKQHLDELEARSRYLISLENEEIFPSSANVTYSMRRLLIEL